MSASEFPAKDLIEDLNALGMNFIVLPDAHASSLRSSIRERYCQQPNFLVSCRCLRAEASVNEADGWKYLAEIIPDQEVIFFFDEDDSETAILVHNTADLVALVGEAHGGEYIITTWAAEWIVFDCWNMLLATGIAAEWLTAWADARK